jgi:hypothetical protein
VRLTVWRPVIDYMEQEGIGVGAVLMILNPEPWISMVRTAGPGWDARFLAFQ